MTSDQIENNRQKIIARINSSKQNINAKVQSGQMTQDEANKKLAALNQQLQDVQSNRWKQNAEARVNNSTDKSQAGTTTANMVGNTFAMTRYGTKDPTGESAGLREGSQASQKQAAQEQINAQQNKQIANRNYRGEAEKNAIAGAATENAQRLKSLGASAGGGAAALNRTTQSADYNTHMNRSDVQRQRGVENAREGFAYKAADIAGRANAASKDYRYAEQQQQNIQRDNLTAGGYGYGNTEANPMTEQNVDMLNQMKLKIDAKVQAKQMSQDEANIYLTQINKMLQNKEYIDNNAVAETFNRLRERGAL